jgi:pyrimidine deaminase RibD-like protein
MKLRAQTTRIRVRNTLAVHADLKSDSLTIPKSLPDGRPVLEMTEYDRTHMNSAISLAEQCEPIADRIPKVGAIIAVGKVVIGQGHRGTGKQDDDDHAEKTAINSVADKKQLPEASIYTTLEPCTGEVRTDPLNCCTELISQFGVKRVFIGILDPNQGVRGKGLWELQTRGIDVELFPPELANRLRSLNREFIRVQQTLGIRITNLKPGQTIKTHDRGGVFELEGKFLNPPGADVFAFIGNGGQWWPQPHALHVTGERRWTVKLYFGSYGPHTVCIVKASELGAALVAYYRKVSAQNVEREQIAREYFLKAKTGGEEILTMLKPKYPGIAMGALPKGIEVQDIVDIIVETPLPTGGVIKQIS